MTGRILGSGRYGLADLRVGDIVQTGRRLVSVAAIDAFADMTGDRFEIHMDKAAAQKHGFPERVAHGLLVLSFVDGLKNQASAQFNAIASLGWDWGFVAPVFAEDEIGATITVTGLRASSDGKRGVAMLDFDVRNERGETVQRGVNRLMVYV